MATTREFALICVRQLCLALPEVVERPSNGAPSFFVAKRRMFLSFHDDHHGDGRLGIWCAAPQGAQEMLVSAAPDSYYVPAYVGYLGWIGLRLDREVGWEEVAGVIEDAWSTRAPRALMAKAELASMERE
ncbi:MAG TPA: MmcQ/YjbR family DNA-binding protein [Solirubrobacteraceae bacterium]|nr:MmcQ/YjbR family DNA-binding protein [Solirubrobacteraceae bacterium]